jgi:uncharacterized protein YoxC
MDTVTIFTILLLAAATGLCIALIIYLKKITSSFEELRQDIRSLADGVRPLLNSTTELSEKLNKISEDLNEPVQTAKTIMYDIKNRVDTVLELEEKLRGGLEGSVTGLIKNLSSIANGVSTFWNTYKKNNR